MVLQVWRRSRVCAAMNSAHAASRAWLSRAERSLPSIGGSPGCTSPAGWVILESEERAVMSGLDMRSSLDAAQNIGWPGRERKHAWRTDGLARVSQPGCWPLVPRSADGLAGG